MKKFVKVCFLSSEVVQKSLKFDDFFCKNVSTFAARFARKRRFLSDDILPNLIYPFLRLGVQTLFIIILWLFSPLSFGLQVAEYFPRGKLLRVQFAATGLAKIF